MSSEDVTMMGDDLSSSASTESLSSLFSSSLLACSSSTTNSRKPSVSTTTSNKRRLILFTFPSGHNLVHHRRKTTSSIPQSSSFFIPESYTNDYCNKARLLLYDSNDPKYQLNQSGHIRSEGRILVWSSDIQLKLLFNSQKLHMDGTFSTSPPLFEQVFITSRLIAL
ncbi:unnamed protein product, partial [Rotaria sp. Silwood2]